MWPFKGKAPEDIPLLRVLIRENEVCAVRVHEVPVEKLPIVELRNREDMLRFVDSQGNVRAFDMSSAFDEGARFFHMSVRVGPSFGVQPDGILTEQRNDDPQEAFKNGAKGLRFQPFLLPESSGFPGDAAGRGLFYRGLHFSGNVTPGNVSLMCVCDGCSQSFRLQSFHAGFGNLVYFYCSGGPHTLTASSNEEDAPPVLGHADPDSVTRFESHLPDCSECGGLFRYMNPLVCPHCAQPFIDFPAHPDDRGREYYGNYIYGESVQRYASLEKDEAVTQPDV
ncbi:hypothetical protein EC912_1146 [Luteibacter rhizovicinus]|uniref:Uncharacterized protein n=1 Tax=Luteibacter rhizovicinus TaxID=242606 RepID=A0A4R3YJD4_9GAMM|nr:hypothetical protein [Luteibacter rhizovicinus]TCV91104.1 hypothetical protein EC912_1146 [Luteibacter rhizovicinus]